MDYVLAALAVIIVAGLAYFYGQINERKQRLAQAYLSLDSTIQEQMAVIKDLYSFASAVPNIHVVHALMKQHQAIRTLGLHAIDQSVQVYDRLHAEVLELRKIQTGTQAAEFLTSSKAFTENHVLLQKNRMVYNRAALAYNDCQRNAIQDWLATRLGHQMAPPC